MQEPSNLCRIFRLRGSTKCLGSPSLEGRNEILLLGKALKFRLILQKYALKLIKFWKIIKKMLENANFSDFFNFRGDNGKNNEYNIRRL